MNTDQTLLTTRETAAYIRVSKATLDVWRSLRRGPSYLKIGHKVVYRKSDLDEFLDEARVCPSNMVRQRSEWG